MNFPGLAWRLGPWVLLPILPGERYHPCPPHSTGRFSSETRLVCLGGHQQLLQLLWGSTLCSTWAHLSAKLLDESLIPFHFLCTCIRLRAALLLSRYVLGQTVHWSSHSWSTRLFSTAPQRKNAKTCQMPSRINVRRSHSDCLIGEHAWGRSANWHKGLTAKAENRQIKRRWLCFLNLDSNLQSWHP